MHNIQTHKHHTKDTQDISACDTGTIRKHCLFLGLSVLMILWLISLPYWLQKPFIPLERTDFWREDSLKQALAPIVRLYQGTQKPAVISLYEPGCLCNIISKRHETALQQLSTRLQVDFYRVDASHMNLPSTPALLILDAEGDIQFFGPFGFGAFCTQDSIPYAQRQLSFIVNHDQTNPIYNLSGDGCYCSGALKPM